jgi:hypothetical protein
MGRALKYSLLFADSKKERKNGVHPVPEKQRMRFTIEIHTTWSSCIQCFLLCKYCTAIRTAVRLEFQVKIGGVPDAYCYLKRFLACIIGNRAREG